MTTPLAQGAHVSRRIFEAIVGVPSPFYGVRWLRPLRPARYALSSLRRGGLSAPNVNLQGRCGLHSRRLSSMRRPPKIRKTVRQLPAPCAVATRARVTRAGSPTRVGVVFQGLTAQDRQRIRTFIEQHLPGRD